jgi:hypothetical protein
MSAMSAHDMANRAADCETLGLLIFLGELLPALASVHICGLDESARTVSALLHSLNMGLIKIDSLQWTEKLLSSLPSAAHLRAALNVTLKLYSQEQANKSDLSCLPLLHWTQLLCDLGASPVKAERKGLIEPGLLTAGLVSLKIAAKQAGITKMHLHHLMRRGITAPARTFSVGGRQHLFSQEQVRNLSRFRHQGYGYGNSLDLGIEGSGIQILHHSKVVPKVTGNDSRTWLDGHELRKLLTRLGEVAVPSERVDGSMICLGSKRIWQNRHVPVLKTFFERLRTGDISLWSYGQAPGFSRFYLGLEGLEFLQRGAVGGGISSISSAQPKSLELEVAQTSRDPTPPPWRRRPDLDQPRTKPTVSIQLVLGIEGG